MLMSRRMTRTLTAAVTALALLVAAVAADGARASQRCRNVGGTHIRATQVRVTGDLGCSRARKTVRRYFRRVLSSAQTDGGCAQIRLTQGCSIGSFVCRTRATQTLRGRSSDGLGTVRFTETDTGPS
jgi:hypothetical protein